jgi:hypothetical protein
VNNPQKIWQSQTAERKTMTARLIEWKVRELRARTRRQWLGTFTGPLAAGFLYAFARKEFPSLGSLLESLFICALAWSLVGLYFLSRGMQSAAMPEDAGLATGLEFCRGELERRRQLLSRLLIWSFGPLSLAIGGFILSLALIGRENRAFIPNGLPFAALIVIWMICYFVIRWREQRELQREIEELNELQRANGR